MKKARRPPGKIRAQIAALPIRLTHDGSAEILLVTTRTTKRWTVPKGWPIKGLKGYEAAGREAMEEAGAVGKVQKKPIGRYMYWKRLDDHFELCRVKLFSLSVQRVLDTWPERDERLRHWFKLNDAADLIEEPGLRAILHSFKPRRISQR